MLQPHDLGADQRELVRMRHGRAIRLGQHAAVVLVELEGGRATDAVRHVGGRAAPDLEHDAVASAAHWEESKDDLLGSIFSGSGLVFYGGLLGGALAVLAWAKWRGVLDGKTFDLAAPGLAAAYAIGRIGCQLAGDGDYGIPWDGPWAMAYPNGTVPTDVPVHPTPVYETIVMGIVTVVLWRWRHRFRPGNLFALWAVFAGAERFLVEFIRRNEEVVAGLTQPQLISIAMILAGGAWIVTHRGPAPAVETAPARPRAARQRA